MSQTGGEARLRAIPERAGQGVHREVVGHEETVEAHMAADDVVYDVGRSGSRTVGIEGRVDHVSGHREGHVREDPEGHKVVGLELLPACLDHG
jgi:hypothetical protein